MTFFALDDEVAHLEQILASANGNARIHALLALSWQLRQRDTRRAVELADQVAALLAHSDLPEPEAAALQARLLLVRAEAKWLWLELDAAQTLAQTALASFAGLDQPHGCADAHWLLSLLAQARGDTASRLCHLVAMEAAAGSDPVRCLMAQAQQAQAAAFRDLVAAKQSWDARLISEPTGTDPSSPHPAAQCHIEFYRAACANIAGDFVAAIGHNIATYHLALASGQLRTAVFAATNAGDAFNSLNEYQAALEWMERGLALARATGWPAVLGAALAQTALTLRHLQRAEAARTMLHEALALLAPQPGSRIAVITLSYLGDAELDCQQGEAALKSFTTMAERADALGQPQLQSLARRGQSQALLQLGQPQDALAAAEAALTLAMGGHEAQIAALQVLAEIHRQHRLRPPADMKAPNATLHYLQRALALAESVQGFIVPPDLLEALAQASDRAGLPAQAYRYARQAMLARKKTHSQQAANRACALQLAWQSHSDQLVARLQRQLAEASAHAEQAAQVRHRLQQRLGLLVAEWGADASVPVQGQPWAQRLAELARLAQEGAP